MNDGVMLQDITSSASEKTEPAILVQRKLILIEEIRTLLFAITNGLFYKSPIL